MGHGGTGTLPYYHVNVSSAHPGHRAKTFNTEPVLYHHHLLYVKLARVGTAEVKAGIRVWFTILIIQCYGYKRDFLMIEQLCVWFTLKAFSQPLTTICSFPAKMTIDRLRNGDVGLFR